jgi:hypothetical protein
MKRWATSWINVSQSVWTLWAQNTNWRPKHRRGAHFLSFLQRHAADKRALLEPILRADKMQVRHQILETKYERMKWKHHDSRWKNLLIQKSVKSRGYGVLGLQCGVDHKHCRENKQHSWSARRIWNPQRKWHFGQHTPLFCIAVCNHIVIATYS